MAYESTSEHGHEPGSAAESPEAQYAEIGTPILKVQFLESVMAGETDETISRVLMGRLLRHAGYAGDPATEPLIGKDRKPVLDPETKEPRVLIDYLSFAAEDHYLALEGILGFLDAIPGEKAYEDGRVAYMYYMEANRSEHL